jgi:hypothetical protein
MASPEWQRNWYLKHREEHASRGKRRYQEHKEEISIVGKKRYQEDKVYKAARNLVWRQANPAKQNLLWLEYTAEQAENFLTGAR